MWWFPVALAADPAEPIPVDRAFEVLTKCPDGACKDLRPAYAEAGGLLGTWRISIAEVELDGAVLQQLAATPQSEPFTRAAREALRRPVDPLDLLYLLDDVLAQGARRGERFVITQSRARDLGALVHPDEVFKQGVVKAYPSKQTVVEVDDPPPQTQFTPAADGEVLGPNWTMRYRPSAEPAEMMKQLAEKRPDYAVRITSLLDQLRAQGADVSYGSFLRFPERGYLMWGAFELKRTPLADQPAMLAKLDAANASWAHVPVTWAHPGGPEATKEAARQMADVYSVVYATESGAKTSKHYTGKATDFTVQCLPRSLTLTSPDGASRTFDLSGAEEPRDLSLTPAIIDWIEAHWSMYKLRGDYPHWEDTK